ncbi:MAG TPA: GntR family transcriptional regulator [Candidimonas sp.]|nr:GntR family transcriptional regulator [Candidimonas sp.]
MRNELSAEQAKWLLAAFGDPAKVTWTLPEQIANRLGADIIRGVFVPGQPLMEVMLAETYFHVSRGPVREALRILESEGLVQIRPRRGAIVAELSASDIKEIFSVRAVLYGFVVSELAKNRTDSILAELHHSTRAITTALDQNNVDEFIATIYRLSMYLPEVAGNSYARKIIVSLGRQTLVTTRKVMLNKENCRMWLGNWKRLVKAIEQRDPRAGDEAGRKLVHDVYECTMKMLQAPPAPTADINNHQPAPAGAINP